MRARLKPWTPGLPPAGTFQSRRRFLKLFNRLLAVTGLALIFGPIIAYFYPPNLAETPAEPVLAGSLAELRPGQSKTIRFGRYPALVIHTAEGLRAYSAVCPHFACLVKWEAGAGQIRCPCHDAFFNLSDGGVISGPAPAPLTPLPVKVVYGQIYVGGEG